MKPLLTRRDGRRPGLGGAGDPPPYSSSADEDVDMDDADDIGEGLAPNGGVGRAPTGGGGVGEAEP